MDYFLQVLSSDFHVVNGKWNASFLSTLWQGLKQDRRIGKQAYEQR